LAEFQLGLPPGLQSLGVGKDRLPVEAESLGLVDDRLA